jgi:hypothetical protein
MYAARHLTLLWPGLPWLWLRGSLMGLVLALAFGVAIDVAVVTTWIWTGLVEPPFLIALWTATAAIWLVSTVSAAAAFPPPIRSVRPEQADALFLRARDAYLARDWVAAETRRRDLLAIAPTDGEAQLLLGTLLRRVGRPAEARQALAKLSRSDSGAAWLDAIATELRRLDDDAPAPDGAVVRLADVDQPARPRNAAA